jgi:hypothetical protein
MDYVENDMSSNSLLLQEHVYQTTVASVFIAMKHEAVAYQ